MDRHTIERDKLRQRVLGVVPYGTKPKLVEKYVNMLDMIKNIVGIQMAAPSISSENRDASIDPEEWKHRYVWTDEKDTKQDLAFFLRFKKRESTGFALEVVSEPVTSIVRTVNLDAEDSFNTTNHLVKTTGRQIVARTLKEYSINAPDYHIKSNNLYPTLSVVGNDIARLSKRGAGNVIIANNKTIKLLLEEIYNDTPSERPTWWDKVARLFKKSKNDGIVTVEPLSDVGGMNASYLSYKFTLKSRIRVFSSDMMSDKEMIMLYNNAQFIADNPSVVYIKGLNVEHAECRANDTINEFGVTSGNNEGAYATSADYMRLIKIR